MNLENNCINGMPRQSKNEEISTGATETEHPPADVPRILLVDDSPENRELMGLLLSRRSLSFDEASNGLEAVKLFEANDYTLILMDIQMPVMDGYTATRMIRDLEKRSGCCRTPVVALTAYACEADVLKSRDAGCDDHIAKPFKKKVLLQCLSHHIPGIEHG